MEYPHRKYLYYLVSRKMTSFEIMSDCTDKGLIPPNEDELKGIVSDLGAMPKSWSPKVTRNGVVFRRWLRDRGLLEFWRKPPDTQEAISFLYRTAPRKDFEALMIMHGDTEKAREELLLKYPENMVPSEDVLSIFCEYFWNLGSITQQGLFNFLKVNQERAELLPAVQGDLATTYGRLGLRQRIEAEEFYDNLIAFANQQVQAARKDQGVLNGSMMMGIAALSRQACDAIQARDDIHQDSDIGVLAAVRDQASIFKLRMVESEEITAFDDLDRVIDAEYAEVDNVRSIGGD